MSQFALSPVPAPGTVNIEELTKPFPPEAIKSREGAGKKRFDYVSVDTVIRRLNRACGSWDWVITRVEWRDDAKGSLCIVYGELTIPPLGKRSGVGVQSVSERGGEDLIKGASGDGLKKAATLFGVAIDLYGPDAEAEAELIEARAMFARAVHQVYGDNVLNAGGHPDAEKLNRLFFKIMQIPADDATVNDFMDAALKVGPYRERLQAEKARASAEPESAPSDRLLDVPPATNQPSHSTSPYDPENDSRGPAEAPGRRLREDQKAR